MRASESRVRWVLVSTRGALAGELAVEAEDEDEDEDDEAPEAPEEPEEPEAAAAAPVPRAQQRADANAAAYQRALAEVGVKPKAV